MRVLVRVLEYLRVCFFFVHMNAVCKDVNTPGTFTGALMFMMNICTHERSLSLTTHTHTHAHTHTERCMKI